MRLPKIREIVTAVKALITKPYTTKFPFRPHIPFKSFRGKPYFDKEKCVGCSACVNVCPTGALSFKDIKTDSGFKRVLKIRWDICIECGQCQLNCLTSEGIVLSNEYDLSVTEERKSLSQEIEKELVCCEVCGRPIACIDHLRLNFFIQYCNPCLLIFNFLAASVFLPAVSFKASIIISFVNAAFLLFKKSDSNESTTAASSGAYVTTKTWAKSKGDWRFGNKPAYPNGKMVENFKIKLTAEQVKLLKENDLSDGGFVKFDDCVKLNNNKVAQDGGCGEGDDGVVSVTDESIYLETAKKTGKTVEEVKSIIKNWLIQN